MNLRRLIEPPEECLIGASSLAPCDGATSEKGRQSTPDACRLGRCTNSCASSQRWSRRRPSCNSLFGRFTATRRPWMDLENTAAIFAAAAKKAHSVAATAESIQSVDFGSGVELGRVLLKREMSASL